jgi:hypothetical protein
MEVIQSEDSLIKPINGNIVYKTPSYTLRAIRKYHEKNREKINEKKKEKYKNDPEFRERERQKAKERYYRKKEQELKIKENK